MVKKESFTKDTVILFILLNVFNALNFLYHFVVARVLTPADYGILVALFSIIYLFNIPSEAIQNIFSRLTSNFNVKNERGKIKHILVRGLEKGFVVACGLFIGMLIISFFLSSYLDIPFWLFVVTDSLIFFFVLGPIPRGILQGEKKFVFFGMTFVIESLFRLAFSVFFVLIGWKIFGAIFGVFLGILLGFIFSFWGIRELFNVESKSAGVESAYSFSLPFFIVTFVIMMLLSIDTILARRFFAPDVAGHYAVLSTLGKIIFFGTASVSKTMFPSASEYFDNKISTKKLFIKSFFVVVGLSIIALFGFWLIPNLIVGIGFGEEYLDVAHLLIYSGIALSLLALANLGLLYGLATHRIKHPSLLFIFVILQIGMMFLFHGSIQQYLFGIIVANSITFIGSLFLLKRWK